MIIKEIAHIQQRPKQKNVAAYARVSCGTDEMLHSLAAQVSTYSGLIQSNPKWNYRGVYADEALTGTKDDRPEFQRLITDCRAGLIEMVITKSISRFARNTVTLLATVRELKLLGIDVFFEEQNIHSLSVEGELMLTILAGYAQEESRSVSENCKWRIRKDFEQGKPNTGRLMGYRLKDGVFVIVPEEAEIVRQIFTDYLSGMGLIAIQKKLLVQGIEFSKRGVLYILTQEKYIGDMLLQKTFIENHMTKRKVNNTGQLPQFYVSDSHESIVSREIFEAVQAEIDRRSKHHPKTPPKIYPFTSMIKCGICGANYTRKHTAAGTKYEKVVWICPTFNFYGKDKCNSQQIPETILEAKTAEAGGFDELIEIRVPGKNQLSFIYADSRQVDLDWANPSRSESWTDEMKEQARIRAGKRGGKNG